VILEVDVEIWLGLLAVLVLLGLAIVVINRNMPLMNSARAAVWFDPQGRRLRGVVIAIRPHWFITGPPLFVVRMGNGKIRRVLASRTQRGKQP